MKIPNTSLILLSILAMGCGRNTTTADSLGRHKAESEDPLAQRCMVALLRMTTSSLRVGLYHSVWWGWYPSQSWTCFGTFEPTYGMVYGSGFFFDISAPSQMHYLVHLVPRQKVSKCPPFSNRVRI